MRLVKHLLAYATALAVPLCTWAQTETEPNNSSGSANPVAYNTAMAGSSGVCSPTDNSVDYFTFTPPAQGVMRINTAMSNNGGGTVNVTLQVRDAATNVIATYIATAGAANVAVNNTFTFPCQGTGVYFLNVNNPGFGVCINYSFTYDIIAPVFANDAEPNNGSGSAVVAAAGVDHDGHLDFRYDINSDYFRLQAPTDGVLNVTVQAEHASSSTTDSILVRLRDAPTNVLVTWKVGIGANGIPNTQTLSRTCAGTEDVYYLEFPSPTACGVSYRFSYTVTQPVYADDLEPNQSSGAAIIANANTNYDGRVEFNYDNNFDYFRLQAPTDGVMSVTIQAEHAGSATGGTMTLYLRDAPTNAIETWTVNIGANGVPASNTFVHRCTGTEQVYYLEPDNPSVCGVSYRFSYAVTPPVFADDSEPNQSSGQADTALAGIDYDGRLDFRYDNDFDYFRLQAPTDGVLNVTIQAENAGPSLGTMTLYLRDASTNVIETWTVNIGANGTSAPQTFSHTCTGTEQVYFLEPDNPTVCGVSYRFSYTVTPPVFADDLEPNQSSGAAIVANANTNYDGRVEFNYDNNIDYFRLQAPTDGVMSVTIQAEHAGTATGSTMTLYLRDAPTNVIETWTVNIGANGVPVSNTFTHLCTGTEQVYYLEPDNPSVCGVSYRFIYSVAGPVFADDLEPNQSSGQAIIIDLNAAPADGRVEFEYDNNFDYFRINHTGGPIVLKTQAEAAGAAGTMQVLIRDAATNVLQTAVVPVGGTSIPVTNTYTSPSYAAGIYYIEPFNPTSCGTSYRFDCYDDDNDGVCNSGDLCANTPTGEGVNTNGCSCSQVTIDDDDVCTLDECLNGNVTNTFQDADGDLTCDANDGCPNDANKIAPGACGCGVADTDTDSDGTADCNDGCPNDANKIAPGICGCGVADTDTDSDGTADCNDGCPNDANKIAPGICGCGVADTDTDSDGTADCNDPCPLLANLEPGDPCDDNNANTINDVVGANCICAGTLLGNDCEGVPGGPAQPGTACNDNNACTINDVYDVNCVCAGTFEDTDSDGICDADDNCPELAGEQGDACDDLNPNTTGDVITVNCVCAGTLANDCEGVPGGPAQPGTACNDNNACTINDVYDANCVCAGTFEDTDSDGICDADDNCPELAGEQGDACNDGNSNTTGDVITENCVCMGTLANDCEGVPGGPAQPGTSCNDNDVCTINDVYDVSCACAGTFEDTDSDGTCDQNDGCPTDPNKIAPGICGCGVPDTDGDGDGIANCFDSCPNVVGQVGSPCNDNNTNTENDVIGANCECAGTQVGGCTENLTLAIKLDNNGSEITWILWNANETQIIDQGGPYQNGQAGVTITENLCVPVGCYHLEVSDAGGNGITNGGYTLRDANSRRIIDANGLFTSVSEINATPNREFCLPLTNLSIKTAWCDNNNLQYQSPIYCNAWPGAIGYQFWFFDPHGSYNRRVIKPTNQMVPVQLTTNPIPTNLVLNVRARAQFPGNTFGEFGPACRMRFVPNNSNFNGGETRELMVSDEGNVTMTLFPNPNRDGVVTVNLTGLVMDEVGAEIEIYDALGQRVHAERAMIVEGQLNTTMTLGRTLGGGMYLVNVTADGQRFTQRLVIE